MKLVVTIPAQNEQATIASVIAGVPRKIPGITPVLLVDIPGEVNVIATYPVAVLAGSDEALGSAFIAYLLSEEGQTMLVSY